MCTHSGEGGGKWHPTRRWGGLQGPSVLGVAFKGLRGYAGDVSAPAALDLVSTRGNTYIIDLRSDRCTGLPWKFCSRLGMDVSSSLSLLLLARMFQVCE